MDDMVAPTSEHDTKPPVAGEPPADAGSTDEATETTETQEYEGTEGSRWGKIVILREFTSGVDANANGAVEALTSYDLVDAGPHDKGFRTTAEAVERIKGFSKEDYEAEVQPLPKYTVVRVVKTVAPKTVQKEVLEFEE